MKFWSNSWHQFLQTSYCQLQATVQTIYSTAAMLPTLKMRSLLLGSRNFKYLAINETVSFGRSVIFIYGFSIAISCKQMQYSSNIPRTIVCVIQCCLGGWIDWSIWKTLTNNNNKMNATVSIAIERLENVRWFFFKLWPSDFLPMKS